MTAPIGVLVMAYGTASGPDDIERYYTDIRGGRAHTVRGARTTVEALPLDATLEILRKYNVLGLGSLRPHGAGR